MVPSILADTAPCYMHETSASSLTSESWVSSEGNIQVSKVSVNQDSDESDSEIFRVKRRSSVKLGPRNVIDENSLNFEQQV